MARSYQSSIDQALLYAVRRNDYYAVERALKTGSFVDVRTEMGGTSLMVAASNGSFRIMELLIRRGADVDA